jgi:hypothetical protein
MTPSPKANAARQRPAQPNLAAILKSRLFKKEAGNNAGLFFIFPLSHVTCITL